MSSEQCDVVKVTESNAVPCCNECCAVTAAAGFMWQQYIPQQQISDLCFACAVMQHEFCEVSWRAAGFRIINHTTYLGCCSRKNHRCWNQQAQDPVYAPQAQLTIPVDQQPQEKDLLAAIVFGCQRPEQRADSTIIASVLQAIHQHADLDKVQ